MVAKGHHFSGVELAAVIDADTSLALPDFRAEERTFQLITQLAGRSGRDAPGRVIVQTFQPDARPIVYAARHDVRALPRRGARRGARARLPARRAPRAASSSRGPARAASCGRAEELAAGLRRRRASRPCAAPAPARRSPGRADRQDRPPARGRGAGRAPARRGRAGDAPRRARGRRRRRSAVALSGALTEGAARRRRSQAHWSGDAGRRDPRRVGRPRRHPALQARARRGSSATATLNPLVGEPLRRRLAELPAEPDRYLASLGGPLPYMRRLRTIEEETERAPRSGSREARAAHAGDAAGWRGSPTRWDFGEVNELIEQSQPLLPDRGAPADGPALARLRQGRRAAPTGASPLDAAWVLERFPA